MLTEGLCFAARNVLNFYMCMCMDITIRVCHVAYACACVMICVSHIAYTCACVMFSHFYLENALLSKLKYAYLNL